MQKERSRFAVGSLFFLHGLSFSSWGSRIPAIQDKLGLSEMQLGSVLFAIPVGLLVSMPLTTWMVSHFGSKKVLLFAALLYATTLVSLGLASSPLQLVGLLLVFGMGGNMVNVSLNTQAVAVESLYGKSIMASLHGLWSLAGFTGAAVGTLMIALKTDPFRHFLFILAFAVLAVLATSRYFLPEPSGQEKPPIFVLPDKALVGLGLIAFCSMICEGAMFDWSGVYFEKVVLAERAWVGVGYTAFMSTMAGTRFLADRLVGRYGLTRILQASGVMTTAGLLLSVFLPQLPTATLGFLLVGSGVSAVVPLVFSEAGKSSTLQPAAAIAAVSTIGFVGFLVGPPIIGWVAGATSLRVSFSLVGAMGLCISLLPMGFRRA